jgi:hypothetical protein
VGQETQWRRCSACKQPIAFASRYWTCGVSTCNRERTGLVFCSVRCWEVHLPSANHRDAWAVEKTSPAASKPAGPAAQELAPARSTAAPKPPSKAPEEVLIVASRLKDYIRASSGFNTSDRVLAPLSAIVRRLCDEAVQSATREGRTTVLERDIPRG